LSAFASCLFDLSACLSAFRRNQIAFGLCFLRVMLILNDLGKRIRQSFGGFYREGMFATVDRLYCTQAKVEEPGRP